MVLDIQARGFTLTDALSNAIGTAARRYAATFRRAVRRVAVRVYDLNGPRGGADKGCLVVADLADGRVIVSTDVDGDLYRAIPRAFAKLRRGTLSRTRRAQAQRRPEAALPRGLVTLRRRARRDDGGPLDPAPAG